MKNKLGVLLTLGALVILVGAGCAKTESPTGDDQKQVESTENQTVNTETVKTETEDSNENEVENEVESDDTTKPATSVKPTTPVTPAAPTTPADTVKSKLTVAEVAKHNTSDDCYIIVSGSVYDVTKFTFKHPGGSEAIIPLCGKDATAPFTQQHSGQSKPANVLTGLGIGPLQK